MDIYAINYIIQTMVLIGILGKKYNGKDTCADYIVSTYGYTKTAFAEPLKKITRELFQFSDEQLYGNLKETIDSVWNITPRAALQFIGTDLIRKNINQLVPNVGEDFWVKIFENMYTKMSDHNIIVADVRFQNEVDCIKKLGGIIIKVERSTNYSDDHISEKNIDLINNYDYLILNNSDLKTFYINIERVFKNINKNTLI